MGAPEVPSILPWSRRFRFASPPPPGTTPVTKSRSQHSQTRHTEPPALQRARPGPSALDMDLEDDGDEVAMLEPTDGIELGEFEESQELIPVPTPQCPPRSVGHPKEPPGSILEAEWGAAYAESAHWVAD